MKKIRNLFVCLGLLGCSLATVACSNNKTSDVEVEPYKVTFYDGNEEPSKGNADPSYDLGCFGDIGGEGVSLQLESEAIDKTC